MAPRAARFARVSTTSKVFLPRAFPHALASRGIFFARTVRTGMGAQGGPLRQRMAGRTGPASVPDGSRCPIPGPGQSFSGLTRIPFRIWSISGPARSASG
ncbi:hypothetical protein GCM10027202_05120 [Microvirgula curvata]